MDEKTLAWSVYPLNVVMEKVGQAHESLGTNVTETPVRVKVEGQDCTDLGLVDLPGFRAYCKDEKMQELSAKIDKLVSKFMQDENNTMICVEEAGDAAGFATLGRCKQLDPSYRRTILVRNKLDKYYNDLNPDTINHWLDGYGDLPKELSRFAVSLPHWSGAKPSKPFGQMREECSRRDVETLSSKGASQKYLDQIGFEHFRSFTEVKTQQLFADALSPLLARLTSMREESNGRLGIIETESKAIDEDNILHSTRSAGISFAQSFNFLMEGALSSEQNRRTMEEELREFHNYVKRSFGDDGQPILNDEECNNKDSFSGLDDYITYLREVVKLPGMDVQLNGGAQFRRLMHEVEVFTRFAVISQSVSEHEVIQARGVGTSGDTQWSQVINSLMAQTAPTKMMAKTKYVGERLKWFFTEQKEATVQFMLGITGSPEEHLFSRLITKQAQVIQRNATMKACIFKAFDKACDEHQSDFMLMWQDYMDSMFQNPLNTLKTNSMPKKGGRPEDEIAPTFESTKERIKEEIQMRDQLQRNLRNRIKAIPEDGRVSESAREVQRIINQTFGAIRCVVADQMQLYSESFFLLPMLRRLEGAMANLQLAEEDQMRYRVRKTVLVDEKKKTSGIVSDLDYCIEKVQKFKVTCGLSQ